MLAVIVHTHGAATRSPSDPHVRDLRRSLTVNAKLAMCLQPEFDQVSIGVIGPTGDLSTWAQEGELVSALDQLQHDLGEGPCHDSIRTAECIAVPHIRRVGRWRRYGPAAAALGLRSQVSVPLRYRDGEPLGALNMYSTTHSDLSITAPLVAKVLAAEVAGVIAGFREIRHLHSALDVSTIIGQATGVVMARLEVDADHASAYLRRVSMLRNQKLVQVADDLVRTGRLPPETPD